MLGFDAAHWHYSISPTITQRARGRGHDSFGADVRPVRTRGTFAGAPPGAILTPLEPITPSCAWNEGPSTMSRLPSNRTSQSFVEYALIIILLAIVLLSILLILGDDLRTFINDLLQTWFPSQPGLVVGWWL